MHVRSLKLWTWKVGFSPPRIFPYLMNHALTTREILHRCLQDTGRCKMKVFRLHQQLSSPAQFFVTSLESRKESQNPLKKNRKSVLIIIGTFYCHSIGGQQVIEQIRQFAHPGREAIGISKRKNKVAIAQKDELSRRDNE